MRQFLFTVLNVLVVLSQAQTFTSTPNAPIGDNATTDFPISVSGLPYSTIDTSFFGLETVCINLTHTWDADLDIYIVAPDGNSALLVSGQGGSDDNYTNTCFNYDAVQFITNASAPFTGTFRPMGQMGLLNNGQAGNGVWTLRIIDTYPADAGNLISWSITFGNSPAGYFSVSESNLPIFVINTNGQGIPDEPKIDAELGIVMNGAGIRNHLTDPFNNYNGYIAIEQRGSSSAGFPKKSYSFELRDSSGNDIESSICGFPTEEDWILSAQYTDKSLMRGSTTFNLIRKMGWYAPRTQPVELFLNGEYKGVYILMEKIKRDNNRVDIAKLLPTDTIGDELTGGYIIKVDKAGGDDVVWYSPYAPWPSGDPINFIFDTPDGNEIMPQQADYIKAYVDSFETALAGPNFADPISGFRAFADENSCIDAFIISELSKNVDGYRISYFMYKDKNSKGGKLIMAPIWDYDIAWGNANYYNGFNTSGWEYLFNYSYGGDHWLNPFWFERMLQDSVFVQNVRCRWDHIRSSFLSDNEIDNLIDSSAAVLNESQNWNFTVWPILGSYVWPNYYICDTWQQEVDTLKWWIHGRLQWLDNNFGGNSALCTWTDIEEFPNNYISVFPNPTTEECNISLQLKVSNSVEVIVSDFRGAQVFAPIIFEGMQGNNQFKIDISGLAEGIYLLRIQSGNDFWSKKIIKIKH